MGKKKKSTFDGIVSFNIPVHIQNDKGDVISIYGLLFNKDEFHHEDLSFWALNRFLCYIMAAEKVQNNGGGLAPEIFYSPSGRMIKLGTAHKNLIYRLMREELMGYRIVEFVEPLLIGEDEADDIFIISNEFICQCLQSKVI